MNSMRFTTIDNKEANKQYYVNTTKKLGITDIKAKMITNSNMNGNNLSINKSISTTASTSVSTKVETGKPPTKKMKWGEPIWYLFHTLAHKIKDDNFQQVRTELLTNIYNICNNLPCPVCATHAIDYLNKVNFNTITKKQDLKDLLFVFHNSVNERKGLPIFQYSDLDSKYEAANTINIIYNFINHFQDKHKSIHMISNDMYRARQVAVLKDWFNKNIQYFNP